MTAHMLRPCSRVNQGIALARQRCMVRLFLHMSRVPLMLIRVNPALCASSFADHPCPTISHAPQARSTRLALQSNGWKVVSTINMIIIFLIFGISIETKELKSALKAWKALLLGLTTILVWTSFLGFLPLKIPMKPYEFSIGMAIFSCVPTSLSSGVTLVIQASGAVGPDTLLRDCCLLAHV